MTYVATCRRNSCLQWIVPEDPSRLSWQICHAAIQLGGNLCPARCPAKHWPFLNQILTLSHLGVQYQFLLAFWYPISCQSREKANTQRVERNYFNDRLLLAVSKKFGRVGFRLMHPIFCSESPYHLVLDSLARRSRCVTPPRLSDSHISLPVGFRSMLEIRVPSSVA